MNEADVPRGSRLRKRTRTRWEVTASWVRAYKREDGMGLALTIVCINDLFTATAVETPGRSAQEFLDTHGHALIVEDSDSLANAKHLCQAFAAQWVEGAPIEECACEEIEL